MQDIHAPYQSALLLPDPAFLLSLLLPGADLCQATSRAFSLPAGLQGIGADLQSPSLYPPKLQFRVPPPVIPGT